MFKDRPTAVRVCLKAGVGSTLPLSISSINRGWEPGQVPQIDGDNINFIIHDDKLLDKLTLGAVYYAQSDDKTPA